jgi:hypothetical protein
LGLTSSFDYTIFKTDLRFLEFSTMMNSGNSEKHGNTRIMQPQSKFEVMAVIAKEGGKKQPVLTSNNEMEVDGL